MANRAIRAAIFGILASTVFGITTAGILAATLPTPIDWPLKLYRLGGLPIALLLERFTNIDFSIYPDSGLTTGIVAIFVSAFITWAAIFSVIRVIWLRIKYQHVTTQSFRNGSASPVQAIDETPGADQICEQCGHLFNPHRLLGYGDPPTEGWMECPVEGCECRMTWSMDPSTPDNIKHLFKPPSVSDT